MEKISNSIPTEFTQGQRKRQPAASAESAADLVNEVFIELQSAFPAWRYAIDSGATLNAVKQSWMQAFFENGINRNDQIQAGLRKARKSASPHFPSSGEFIGWCTPEPEDYGLPGDKAAYKEACQNSHDPEGRTWSHPAIFVAGRETAFFDLASRPEREMFPLFRHNYRVVCQRVMAGQRFDGSVPKALPKPTDRSPSSKQSAMGHLAGIMNSLGATR